jgi:hypothetical protein
VWVNPEAPTQSIIERQFAGGDRVWPPVIPMLAASWLAVACVVWPPNRPRDQGDGTLAWTARRIRLARVLVDTPIGLSVVAAYVWLYLDRPEWGTGVCATIALLMFGPLMLPVAFGSVMRGILPRVSATMTPTAHGWRVRYAVSGGLVRPRRLAVSHLTEHRWNTGSGNTRQEHHATPYLQTLASHDQLPASGELDVPLTTVVPERRRERVREFLIFRGGLAWWPDLHESLRLPTREAGKGGG